MFDIQNIINAFLAPVLDRLKTKNPLIWGIIAVVISVSFYTITQGSIFGIWNLTPDLQKALEWLSFIAALFTGSRTTKVLQEINDKNSLR